MRALSWIVVAACGGATAPNPISNVAPPGSPPTPAPPVVLDCEPRASGFPPGHHDRYSFEDALTHLHGFKDGRGNVVIQPRYSHVYAFSPGGVAAVVSAGAFSFIDPAGKQLARAYAFDNGPDYFQEGYARIVDDRQQVGFLDERGRIAIAPQYTAATPFCHGRSTVELAGARFAIDRTGARVPDER